MDDPTRAIKASIDASFAGAFVGVVMGLLPAILLILGVLWYAIQIWESASFQKLVGRLSQHLRWKQAKKALDAGAPLVVLQSPPVPTDAVVVLQPSPEPGSPPPGDGQT